MGRLLTVFLVMPLLGAVAAPAAAQTPTTTEDLLAGMVTEEVEPGVYRVVNDGVRGLAAKTNTEVVVGHDGGVWLLRKNRHFRLGEDRRRWPTERPKVAAFEVAPDGTVWVEADGAIHSFDGMDWTTHERWSLEVAPDGTVWAMWPDPQGAWQGRFGYLDEEGWQPLGHASPASAPLVAGPEDIWADGFAGYGPSVVLRFVDGGWQHLVRLEGTEATWQPAEDLRPEDPRDLVLAGLGSDGTTWLWAFDYARDSMDLVRFDGGAWSRWLVDSQFHPFGADVEVAPDGSVWYALGSGDGCAGVGHFDGETWDRQLSDICVLAIDISADGAVWVLEGAKRGRKEPRQPRYLYVITPEAVAAVE